MRAVLVSRYPRVDTPAWKRTLARRLEEAGFELGALYSRSHVVDQAAAGWRENGLGIVKRYASLRRGASGGGQPAEPAQSLASWLEERGAPVVHARRLGDPDAVEALRRLDPDLLVLVGADIVPGAVLECARLGTINPHYGILPAYRGMNVAEWSVFCGDPVGVTVHLVDTGIDTGAILEREEIPIETGETFETIRGKQQEMAARLLFDAATALRDGTTDPIEQSAAEGRQYYRMHPLIRGVAEARLARQAAAA